MLQASAQQFSMADTIRVVLCAKCKGRLLCGKTKCPLTEKFRFAARLSEGDIEGATPPSVFIGRIGYPKVYAGPLITTAPNPELLDAPWLWRGGVEDVLRLRMSLTRGMKAVEASNTDKRFTLELQEVAASTKHVDVEAEITKVIRRPLFDDVTQPVGVAARIGEFKLTENPKIPDKLEKLYYDDVKAVEAVKSLFNHGFSTYYLQKVFSVGMFGERGSRKLVPTRWSITAVHDILGEEIKKEIADFDTIDMHMLFTWEHFGNRFEVILSPGGYFFQLVEIWIRKSFWSPDSTWVGYDSERIGRKKKYSELSGGYYAARLPALEYLRGIRKQARVTILREITPDYYAPLGVWVVEEGVRRALKSKPEYFDSFSEAVKRANERMKTDKELWIQKLGFQTTLSSFF